MRLSDYRLKFTELISPWITDPPIIKNEILAKGYSGYCQYTIKIQKELGEGPVYPFVGQSPKTALKNVK